MSQRYIVRHYSYKRHTEPYPQKICTSPLFLVCEILKLLIYIFCDILYLLRNNKRTFIMNWKNNLILMVTTLTVGILGITICILGLPYVLLGEPKLSRYWQNNPIDSETIMLIIGLPVLCSAANGFIYTIWRYWMTRPGRRQVH